jgi:hypothetical protein
MTHPDIVTVNRYGELLKRYKGKTIICNWCEETRLFEGSGIWYIRHNGMVVCEKCVKDYTVDFFSDFWLEA